MVERTAKRTAEEWKSLLAQLNGTDAKRQPRPEADKSHGHRGDNKSMSHGVAAMRSNEKSASNPIAIFPEGFHDGERYGGDVRFAHATEQAEIARSSAESNPAQALQRSDKASLLRLDEAFYSFSPQTPSD